MSYFNFFKGKYSSKFTYLMEFPRKKRDPNGLPRKLRTNAAFGYSISGQPETAEYDKMLANLAAQGKKVIVIDLRKEAHVYVSYTDQDGKGKNISLTSLDPEQTGLYENIAKALAEGKKSIQVRESEDYMDLISLSGLTDFLSERDYLLANREVVSGYVNAPIRNHSIPEKETVDMVVDAVKANFNEPKAWIHIHCHGGNARSSIAAAMLVLVTLKLEGKLDPSQSIKDTLKINLDPKSFSKIFPKAEKENKEKSGMKESSSSESLESLGSSDSDDGADALPEKIKERQEFMESFYDYMLDDQYGFNVNSYTKWVDGNPDNTTHWHPQRDRG